MKEIAPSAALRRWFGHDAERWDDSAAVTTVELMKQSELLAELRSLARQGTLTLVYAARDEAHNDAVVLRAALLRSRKRKAPATKPAAGASKQKPGSASTRRAASRRARRSPKR